MATHHGNEGTVKIGANTVAEIVSWSYSDTTETADDTAMGDAAKTHIAGQYSWEGEVACHWDETDTNGQQALTQGASVTLNLYPEGAGAGDTYYTGTATVISRSFTGTMNGIVSATFRFQGNGAVSKTTV